MGFSIEHLDHVALTVSDVDRSIAWYHEVLGLECLFWERGVGSPALLSNGSASVALFPAGSDVPAPPPKDWPDDLAMWHMAFRVNRSNFAAAQRHLKGLEVPFAFGDHGISQSLYFTDPDGHLIEVTTYEL